MRGGAPLVQVQEDVHHWKAGRASAASLHPFHPGVGTAGKILIKGVNININISKRMIEGELNNIQINFSPVFLPPT